MYEVTGDFYVIGMSALSFILWHYWLGDLKDIQPVIEPVTQTLATNSSND